MHADDGAGQGSADAFAPGPALVLGAGVSGVAAAQLLAARGFAPLWVASEAAPKTALPAGAILHTAPLAETVRAFAAATLGRGRLCYVSPGLALTHPGVAEARALGFTLCGELSLGGAFYGGRDVAVTGSKGKSSLVKLLADALTAAGLRAEPCGNYGRAFCAVAAEAAPPPCAVVECSSFQLETADAHFRPDHAVLLNLSCDHLNRHGTMEAYRDAKLALFRHLAPGALALVPAAADDPCGLAACARKNFPGRTFQTFGCGADADWRYDAGTVTGPDGRAFRIAGSYFDNAVTGPAGAAACALLTAMGLSTAQVEAAFAQFKPLAHRMQTAARWGAVSWIDNSKATNLDALLASVRMAPKPVLLLAGGRLKEPLSLSGRVLLETGVRKVYTYGEASAAMASSWAPALPTARCETLAEAMATAEEDLRRGFAHNGSVLLAPGTASFDQFTGYEERGDAFQALARQSAEALRTAAAPAPESLS